MKNKFLKIGIGVTLLIIASFTIHQSILVQEEKQLIIGTWIIDNESTNKWVFTSNNQCNWELDGSVSSVFNYDIKNSFSDSGLEHTTLILTAVSSNVSEVGEITKYGIVGLGEEKMMLEYNTGIGISYTHFTKQ